MTQGIYQFPQVQAEFSTANDRLPPCEIEAEEAVIRGILDDPKAIYLVSDRLRPEHFYVSAHRDIYQACLRLSKKGKPTDLLSVTSLLREQGILARIGGQSKMASLEWNVTAVNIDAMAWLVIKAHLHRQYIKLGNDITRLGYETDREIPDLVAAITEKTRSIIETPIAPTKEEHQRWRHGQMLQELTSIYTTCSEPTLRLLKLKDLSDDYRVSMNFLELFYLKSLTEKCSKLLTYQELKELAGSTVREWLINGLVPKSTTILLAADGGIGKTKLAYGIGKVMIQGSQLGPFITTGEKRKILYYQGDESPGDMVQALEALGYSEDDIDKYVRVRFGWSAENMPTLIQDLKEFQPEFAVIDSLSTANKYSIYQESQMEYARPILEMTGLAIQYQVTFLIIHHTNREGGVRGTTAIRNAVSEVWTLVTDKSETATPNDRILEINKSRSRSSNKKYRMFFNPEDLSFSFMGEEGQDFGGSSQNAKEKTLQFLADHRNIKFTSEEIAHRLGFSSAYARKYLSELSADGLISRKLRPGKPNLYYLVYEGSLKEDQQGSPKDHPSDQYYSNSISLAGEESEDSTDPCIKKRGSPQDHPSDHLQKLDAVSDTAKGDPRSPENSKKSEQTEISEPPTPLKDHLRLDALPDIASGGDPKGDPSLILCENIQSVKTSSKDLPDNNHSHSSVTDPGGDPQGDPGSNPSPHSVTKHYKNIEVGGVYLSRSLGKKVKVIQLYLSVKKADVNVLGDIVQPRLSLADLYPLPDDSWSPNVGQLAMYGGELVAIVGFDSGTRNYQVEFESGRFEYVKAKRLAKP
ncbi:DnaB-like helicase N-terminal domain-containing protein [Halotia branconii]|uniref:DnaB-like helicase N-terminal domain-containing protein n=1 Tax=Halotia branconii CENA392 TaxID=1539056 RepID=A0AAJ6P9F4_9CYAN|nr:DnaB-like helicase N-terminal domain-containing protein [Halotia branconii]WGV25676.1 DnaB-like helicase N-terminal domain-containing protein [Halotia branconii CENA392]